MPFFLGKTFIQLNKKLPALVEYHLIDAANEKEAEGKLDEFVQKSLTSWRLRKESSKAVLNGSFIQTTL